jgi:protein-tyrosine phosphatase
MADLLFVCEGNVCRSPFAERVMRSMTTRGKKGPDLTVASAGLRVQPGARMDQETERLVIELGGVVVGHAARRLARSDLESAMLVLTATRAQRAAVVAEHPRSIRYTYTIRQFGRVLAGLGDDFVLPPTMPQAERLAELEEQYRLLLGSVPSIEDDDDVVDPIGRGPEVHRLAASQMLPTLNLIGAAIGAEPVVVPKGLSPSATRHRRSWLGRHHSH